MYYHRAAVPLDIADSYPRSEETFSLRTADRKEALRLVRIAAAEVDQRFSQHRRQATTHTPQTPASDSEISDETLSLIEERYYIHLLDEHDDVRLDGFMPASEAEARSDALWPPSGDEWERHHFTEKQNEAIAMGEDARHLHARGIVDRFYLSEAQEVLTWDGIGIHLKRDSASWKPLVFALYRAVIRASDSISRRFEGAIIDTPSPQPLPTTAPLGAVNETLQPPPNRHTSKGLEPKASEVVQEWITEKSRVWAPKTRDAHAATLDHFLRIVGDKPVSTYSKQDGRHFKETLLKLPANWTKKRALRGLDIRDAAIQANSLGLEPMSITNLNKHLRFAQSFWSWAMNNYDEIPVNPVSGLSVKNSRTAREERNPFTPAELTSIFDSTIYKGCHSESKWTTPGSLMLKDSSMFWMPLLALFTGARMGELLQLYLTDVNEENGISYIEINDDGPDKRLKTRGSKRVIPLHSCLETVGFIDHVNTMRKRGETRLFPDARLGKDGYYSSVYSKRFAKLLRVLNIKNEKNAFHSFRHNFEDACRNSGISSEQMNALQGHSEQGMAGRYGRGFTLETLSGSVERLKYPGLDLSHLCGKAK